MAFKVLVPPVSTAADLPRGDTAQSGIMLYYLPKDAVDSLIT